MLYHLAFSKAAGTFHCLVNNIGDGAQAVKVEVVPPSFSS